MDFYFQLLSWGEKGWGDEFFHGFLLTILLSATSYAIAVVFGFLGAAGKLSTSAFWRSLAGAYTTVVRALPELLVIFLLYFAVAGSVENFLKYIRLAGVDFVFSPFWAACIALAFVCGAFMTEVIRAARLAIPEGQIEAALSIGMRKRKIITRIILPQTLRYAVPGMANLWLNLTKESAIISVLGSFHELLYTGYRAAGATGQYIFFYGFTGLLFLLITLASILVIAPFERRLNRGRL